MRILKEKIQSWQTVFKIFCVSFERFVVGRLCVAVACPKVK